MFFTGPSNHLLLVGGFDGSSYLSDAEVIALSSPSDYGNAKPSALPLDLHGSPVAAAFGKSAVVCGGMTDSGASDECFVHQIGSDAWEEGPSMREGRMFAAASLLNGTWWVHNDSYRTRTRLNGSLLCQRRHKWLSRESSSGSLRVVDRASGAAN